MILNQAHKILASTSYVHKKNLVKDSTIAEYAFPTMLDRRALSNLDSIMDEMNPQPIPRTRSGPDAKDSQKESMQHPRSKSEILRNHALPAQTQTRKDRLEMLMPNFFIADDNHSLPRIKPTPDTHSRDPNCFRNSPDPVLIKLKSPMEKKETPIFNVKNFQVLGDLRVPEIGLEKFPDLRTP